MEEWVCPKTKIDGKHVFLVYSAYALSVIRHYTVPYIRIQVHVNEQSLEV